MKKIIDKTAAAIESVSDFLASLFMAGTFILVLINVILRYVFNSGFAWSEEGARYMFVCMVFMGFITVTKNREPFCVDILIGKCHGLLKRVLFIVQDFVIAVLLYIMGRGGVEMALLNKLNKSPSIGLPAWILYAVMAFSSFIMLFFTLMNLWQDIFHDLPEAKKEEE